MDYPEIKCFINNCWRHGSDDFEQEIINPAAGSRIGILKHAGQVDLSDALEAVESGFRRWQYIPIDQRSEILNKIGLIIQERVDQISHLICLEEGKTLKEARGEVMYAAGFFKYYAGESIRAYGRIIPSRNAAGRELVFKEPIGPSLLLTPWNFPAMSPARKIAMALGAGCSCILKASEETPASAMAIVQACQDAGVPPGVVNLVFGEPARIVEYLMNSNTIRKISFTGSIPVGRSIASRAGKNLQRCTLELGGHAPVIILEDADLDNAVQNLISAKFLRNAGQVCVAPSRFYVQDSIINKFTKLFIDKAKKIKIGNGCDQLSDMGPLANHRRIEAMKIFTSDSRMNGDEIILDGEMSVKHGFFWGPTIIQNASKNSQIMNEEIFGPIAPLIPFYDLDDVIYEANRLEFGLAGYVFTKSLSHAHKFSSELNLGALAINHTTVAYPETPFGGVKSSGDWREGGPEGLDSFMITKYVSENIAL